MNNTPLIQALSKAETYPHPVTTVRLLETHISWVFLTGAYAYKIKKPVNFGFLDFSTLALRQSCCHEEIRLNQRLAKDLYLDVIAITGTPEQPVLGGTGEAFEYAVKMREFPAGFTLSERAGCGQLSLSEIDQMTDIIASFHQTISRTDAASAYGEGACIRHWFNENFTAIAPLLADPRQHQQLQDLQRWGQQQGEQLATLMQARKNQGFVRECHGDLHLSNMTLINGQVTLFDCIEFNPALRWVDVLSDVAFLLVDLSHFGYGQFAHRLLNRYLQATGDYASLALLPYYWVYRAMVCAKIALLRHDQLNIGQDCASYQAFADLASAYAAPRQPILIITHGYSGSGKSTCASVLAETLGAVQIRSDIERKRLFGLQTLADSHSAVGGGIYTSAAAQQTYQHLRACAKAVLSAGYTAIVDGAFLQVWQRQLFADLAAELGVAFVILDMLASESVLVARIEQRLGDASEATTAVLQQQLLSAEPLQAQELQQRLCINADTGMDVAAVVAALAARNASFKH